MEVILSDGGYIARSNGEWREGKYESAEVAMLALSNLSDMDLSQLYLTVLSGGRTMITIDDYENYISLYNNHS